MINHVIKQLYLTRIAKHNVISSIAINVLNATLSLRHVHRPCETAAVLQKMFFIYFAAQNHLCFSRYYKMLKKRHDKDSRNWTKITRIVGSTR